MKKITKHLNSASGFTLIELLIVIVIIGILSGVLIAVMNPVQQQNKAKQTVLRGNVDKICMAMQSCAVSRETGTTCVAAHGNLAQWQALGATEPTVPAGGSNLSYSVTNTAGLLRTIGTWTTGAGGVCTFWCDYNTADGSAVATRVATGATGCLID